MAKTLEELAAEKGFIEAEETAEPTQEVKEDTKQANEQSEILKENFVNAFADLYGINAADLTIEKLLENKKIKRVMQPILELMAAQSITLTTNLELMAKQLIAGQSLTALLTEKQDNLLNAVIEVAANDPEALNDASKIIAYLANNFIGSSDNTLNAIFKSILIFFIENNELIEAISNTPEKLRPLIPFLKSVIDKEPQFKDIPLKEILKKDFDKNGNTTNSEGEQLLKLAKERQASATTRVEHNKVLSPIVKPLNFNFLNSKIANKYITLQDAVQKLDANGQWYFLPLDSAENYQEVVVRKATKRKKAVISPVSLTYKGQLDAKAAKLTGYDSSIMNAIYTLVMAGNTTFFVDDIYKTMSQKDKATEKQLNKILACMNKVSDHVISINVTEELNENLLNIDNELVTEGILEDNLLHFRKLYLKTEKGKVKTAVEILAEPILLTYSKAKNQILTVPTSLLEMKCRVSEETIPIRDYLLKVIHQFKKGYRDNFTINYDNLLSYIGFDSEIKSRTEKNRITADVITILDGFKEKKEITDYKILNGQRNRITAFEIVPRSTE